MGRKLVLASERDDQTVNNLNETEAMLDQDHVYAVFEAAELFTGAKKLAAAGIPTFGWNINPEWSGPKSFFPNVRPICFSTKCSSIGARCRGSSGRWTRTGSRSSGTTSRSRPTR